MDERQKMAGKAVIHAGDLAIPRELAWGYSAHHKAARLGLANPSHE